MPKGTQVAVMTPGQHQKHDLAGARDPTTGTLHHCGGPRKTNALFRDLLGCLEVKDLADRYTRVDVAVDHYKIHQAKAVAQGLAAHPRVRLLFCRPTALGPTRLSARSAMCMTAAPGTIGANDDPL